MTTLQSKTAVVLGGSRGLGRGITEALAAAGARLVAVGRDAQTLRDVAGPGITTVAGDGSDGAFVTDLLLAHDPDVLVIALGAAPTMLPLAEQTWETFSVNWHADVKATFYALRTLLLLPDRPGRRVVVISSGAALHGSPLSGGYAGSKHTQRFLARYAASEAKERGIDLGVQVVLPQLNPNTRLGAAGVRAYAKKTGMDEATYVRERFGEALTPAKAGAAIVELLSAPPGDTTEFLLPGAGLRPVPT